MKGANTASGKSVVLNIISHKNKMRCPAIFLLSCFVILAGFNKAPDIDFVKMPEHSRNDSPVLFFSSDGTLKSLTHSQKGRSMRASNGNSLENQDAIRLVCFIGGALFSVGVNSPLIYFYPAIWEKWHGVLSDTKTQPRKCHPAEANTCRQSASPKLVS